MDDFDLTEQEKHQFELLRDQSTKPSKELENRIVTRLKSLNLIRSQKTKHYLLWPSAVAASIAIFFAGAYWENGQEREQFNYMLLLKNTESFSNSGTVKEYAAWMSVLKKSGVVMDGEKLETTAQVIASGEFNEVDLENTAGYISGYFFLRAKTLDEALEIVKASPHIQHGGTIELRKIERN